MLVVIWDSAREEALEERASNWARVLAAIGLLGGLLTLVVVAVAVVCGGGGLFGRCTWGLGPLGWRIGHGGDSLWVGCIRWPWYIYIAALGLWYVVIAFLI